MTTETIFDSLTADQKNRVENSFGTRESMCSGCAVYLGKTQEGEHTYFWHYGASDGYVVLPIGRGGANSGYEFAHYDYESGNITLNTPDGSREFTTEGVEILPPPFQYLIHVDLRKYNTVYKEHVAANGGVFPADGNEESFLICCGGGSYLPERAAIVAGVEPKVEIPWVANFWLSPWDLTEELTRSAVAITVVFPDDRRIPVL